ncbi:MAG: ABC transporter ATP-binding protein [Nitrospirae bacterium]|nr:ABC transporter ATP-binding protein [Nitrospirota bacterium]
MIDIAGLTKTYMDGDQKITAVDNVTLSVAQGEFVSIIGHSGSGKTTLLSLAGGLTKPDSGRVVIDQTDIWSLPDDALSEFRNKNVNFIFQFASLVPTLTVFENVMLPSAFGSCCEGLDEYAKSLIEMVGLADKMKSYPSRLSGGQQRRVAIARAFVNSPKVILADEPTGDLDEATEAEILDIFRKKNADGVTFLIVTHNQSLASAARKRYAMTGGILKEL